MNQVGVAMAQLNTKAVILETRNYLQYPFSRKGSEVLYRNEKKKEFRILQFVEMRIHSRYNQNFFFCT
jgi:hypothetical protein